MSFQTLDPVLLTELLRTSRDPVFVGIRNILASKHIAVADTALAAYYRNDQGHHVFVVNRDQGEYELVTPDGVETRSWHSLSKKARRDYAPVLKQALPIARGPRTSPAGTLIELQLAGRSDVIGLRLTTYGRERRASFWFADEVFTLDGTVVQRRNDSAHQSSFSLLADIPAATLLEYLPSPPIRLDPDLEVTGLARLQAITNPPAGTTRFVLHSGSSASGVIYNSSVRASTMVRIVFDLSTLRATYTESSQLDDG